MHSGVLIGHAGLFVRDLHSERMRFVAKTAQARARERRHAASYVYVGRTLRQADEARARRRSLLSPWIRLSPIGSGPLSYARCPRLLLGPPISCAKAGHTHLVHMRVCTVDVEEAPHAHA